MGAIMAVVRQPTAQEIGAVYAARVCREPVARELWVSDEQGETHLWLLIDPTDDLDAERALYELVDVIDERFPRAYYFLHVLNPLNYPRDPREWLPGWAKLVPLRAA
jgi:hypothetical protein